MFHVKFIFVKSSPIICPKYCQSNNWWRFRKILWPSQNIWTLPHNGAWMVLKLKLNLNFITLKTVWVPNGIQHCMDAIEWFVQLYCKLVVHNQKGILRLSLMKSHFTIFILLVCLYNCMYCKYVRHDWKAKVIFS